MKERRSLTDGISTQAGPVDFETAKKFIRGEDVTQDSNGPATAAVPDSQSQKSQSIARVSITTRIRADFAEALKKCSLERQLQKMEPNTLQEILEQAIEPWLRSNGYIK